MRRLLVILLFMSSIMWSQEVKVISRNEVLDLRGEEFYFPTLNSDGSKILLTKSNYTGLYLFDFSTKNLTVITEELGAGYRPVFSEDDSKIVYKVDNYEGIKRFSNLVEYDIQSGLKNTFLSNERFMSFNKSFDNGSLIVKTEKLTKIYNSQNLNLTEQTTIPAFAMTGDDCINIIMGNESREYQPFGNGNYIWVSANNNKLLFHFAGKGTFVNDMITNEMFEIGYANSPIFTPDGKYVLYMNDKDNGEVITSSDILVSSLNGAKTFNLTDTSELIELYPQISASGNKIACNTDDGRIFIIEVSFE